MHTWVVIKCKSRTRMITRGRQYHVTFIYFVTIVTTATIVIIVIITINNNIIIAGVANNNIYLARSWLGRRRVCHDVVTRRSRCHSFFTHSGKHQSYSHSSLSSLSSLSQMLSLMLTKYFINLKCLLLLSTSFFFPLYLPGFSIPNVQIKTTVPLIYLNIFVVLTCRLRDPSVASMSSFFFVNKK